MYMITEAMETVVQQKLSKKYQIVKIDKFLLPIEESHRSLVVIKNK